MTENYVRADALTSGDVVIALDVATGGAMVATVANVEHFRGGAVFVQWADGGGRFSGESYRYERIGSAAGEAHRIGWGVDMHVCYCTDGGHADARPFRA